MANSYPVVLKAEMETCMRLLGAPDIKSLGPQHVSLYHTYAVNDWEGNMD